MSAQVAQDLRAAAEVLRLDGWTQEWFEAPNGCKCVMGALGAAIGGDPQFEFEDSPACDRRFEDAVALMRQSTGVGFLTRWNDAPGRTADEVIAALLAAADAAEAQS